MKHLKSLNEFFDSADIRDNIYNYEPHNIEKSLKSPLNKVITQLLASVEGLREFDSEIQNNILIYTHQINKDVYKFFVIPSPTKDLYNCYFNINTLQQAKVENVTIVEIIIFISESIKTIK